MNLRRLIFSLTALLLVTGFSAGTAHAQKRVGEAVVVQKEVLRVAGSAANQINVGEAMMRDDTVQTGNDSAARFVMADSTNLSLGPSASLTLDSTVFNDDHSYRDVAIRMTNGAFRFVTGHSEKNAYKISTPLATIGVRGTILDILTVNKSTTVVLQEGGSKVCATSGQCIDLSQPGDTAILTQGTNGKVTIKKANIPPWTFAKTCAAAAGLCSVNQFADANPTVTPDVPDGGMLCGR